MKRRNFISGSFLSTLAVALGVKPKQSHGMWERNYFITVKGVETRVDGIDEREEIDEAKMQKYQAFFAQHQSCIPRAKFQVLSSSERNRLFNGKWLNID